MVADMGTLSARIDDLQRQLHDLRREVAGCWIPEALPTGEIRALVVRVEEDRVAFWVQIIEEVVMVAALARLPEAPPGVPGLLNLRGKLVPVIDVMARLDRHAREPELTDFIVVTNVKKRPIDFLVQEILQMTTLDAASIERPGSDLAFAPYVLGIARTDHDMVTILSAESLLAMADLPAVEGHDD
jgi:purine-binding chemotaxis protein CheW